MSMDQLQTQRVQLQVGPRYGQNTVLVHFLSTKLPALAACMSYPRLIRLTTDWLILACAELSTAHY